MNTDDTQHTYGHNNLTAGRGRANFVKGETSSAAVRFYNKTRSHTRGYGHGRSKRMTLTKVYESEALLIDPMTEGTSQVGPPPTERWACVLGGCYNTMETRKAADWDETRNSVYVCGRTHGKWLCSNWGLDSKDLRTLIFSHCDSCEERPCHKVPLEQMEGENSCAGSGHMTDTLES